MDTEVSRILNTERLVALRNDAKLSQGQLAEQLGVTRHTIANWENGRSQPTLTLQEISALESALKCKSMDLITRFMRVATVRVEHPEWGVLWQLRHEFKDGSPSRDRPAPNISETLHPGEIPIEGAVRGVWEEQGVAIAAAELIALTPSTEEKDSPSGKGWSKYEFYPFLLQLDKSDRRFSNPPPRANEPEAWVVFEWRK